MVDPGLPTRRGVQVEDHAQPGFPAPVDQPVEQGPSGAFEAGFPVPEFGEEPPVQGDAHGIEPCRLDEADVVLGDVAVAEFGPEAGRLVRADQRLDDARDFRRSARAHELEHVAFGDQPVAEIDPLDGEPLARRIDETGALGANEVGRCGDSRRVEHEQDGDRERTQPAGKTTNFGVADAHQPGASRPAEYETRASRGAAPRRRRIPTEAFSHPQIAEIILK